MSISIARPLFLAALTLGTVSAAWGHGIWFAQRADRLALIYGDGAEDLDVVKRLPKITAVAGVGAQGRPVPVVLEPEGRLAFVNVDHKPAVVTATMNNGLWSKDAAGQWHGKGRDEVAGQSIDAEQRARLLAAVRTLPDVYRIVVQKRFFDDLMPAEIAAALGVPIETVRTRLKRAMDRLRTALA